MNQRRRIEEFCKRWNIPLDRDAEFLRFKNRVMTLVDQTVGIYVLRNPRVSKDFSYNLGLNQPAESWIGHPPMLLEDYDQFSQNPIYETLDRAEHQQAFIHALQCLFWTLADHQCPLLEDLGTAIQNAVDSSPLIDIRVVTRKGQISLYPKGARLLDEGSVNDPLDWLVRHKQVANTFEDALVAFAKNDPNEYRDVINNLRLALEGLLKRVLGNRKSLENQKEPLGKWLNQKGLHVELRGMVQKTVGQLASYNNDWAKHEEANRPPYKPSSTEVEFAIYQTGTLIRLLLQLNGDN